MVPPSVPESKLSKPPDPYAPLTVIPLVPPTDAALLISRKPPLTVVAPL